MTNYIVHFENLRGILKGFPVLFLIGGLMVLGRLLRTSPLPKKYIPWAVSLIGAIVTPMMVEVMPVVKTLPVVMQVFAGLLTGFVASGLYAAICLIPVLKDKEWFQQLMGLEVEPKIEAKPVEQKEK